MMNSGMFVDDNISNLTSASNEASLSSSNYRNETCTMYPQQSHNNQTQPPKKKRNLPGNPDPEAEVIALSPRALMATNRFICEICNKGFQRDQNLQLHRRGHNLPWKLKQRANKEVIRKKVYVCPESSCVHHDPSRALGDLTGIKKHFSRKHGEKKWKCEKCSKRYAVQSDWKAHSKICGTREYRCDCGTLFSRRDSFITHRAFCDALAEESARSSAITPHPLLSSHFNLQSQELHHPPLFQMKREQDHQQNFNQRPDIPSWLACPSVVEEVGRDLSSHLFSSTRVQDDQPILPQENPNPNHTLPPFQQAAASSPHMSATALLQKAAQMGVTINRPCQSSEATAMFGPHQAHMTTLTPFGNNKGANIVTSGCMEQVRATNNVETPSLLHDMMTPLSSTSHGFQGSTFLEAFDGILNQKQAPEGCGGGGGEGLTRDFLGLRAFPHRGFVNMAGLDHISNSSYHHQNQNQTPWQG